MQYFTLKSKPCSRKARFFCYDIHTGTVVGLAKKTVAFLISLLIPSFLTYGFYIWWGRNKKRKSTTTAKA
ncbi:PepSY domain-containing protein [Flavobacterium sp. ZT3R17]|uniref:PepSY domain-containing protein n=1 Tax=Flavobacterium cryoconiti TaxID=3398736 RepID=UPI003A8AC5D4